MSDYQTNIKVTVEDSELDQTEKRIQGLDGKTIKLNVSSKDIASADKSLSNISKSAKTASTGAVKLGKSLHGAHGHAKSLSKTFENMTVGTATYKTIELIASTARKAIEAVKELDGAIVDLQNATNDSYIDVRNMMTGYSEMGKEIGATTAEIASGANNWLRQGKSIAETNTLLKDSMVLSKVAKLDSEESTEYLTAISKGYKIAVDDVSSINDSLTSIDMAAAVDAGGLAEATSKVASSADLAGVGLNRLLGYAAVIGETSQESMTVIGNSLKTVFARMSDIKAGKLELVDEDGTIQTLSDVETVLANIGVPLRDAKNEFRDFDVVLDEVAAQWKNLNSVQQSAISKAFAGTRQQNRFKLLMENYETALKYEELANQSTGTALAKFEENYLTSIEAKTKSLQASFEALATNTLSRGLVNGVLEATQALVEFLDKTGAVKGALLSLSTGGVIKGFSMLASSIVNTAGRMQNFQQALSIVNTGSVGVTEMQQLVALTDGLSKSQMKAVFSSQALNVQQVRAILAAQGLGASEVEATIATLGLTNANISLSASLKGLWATMLANPIMLLVAAVAAGTMAFSALKKEMDEAGLTFEGAKANAQESAEAYQNTTSEIESLNRELQTTQDRIEELEAMDSLTLSEEAELENLQKQNQLLQNQLEIKEKLAQTQAKEAAEDARNAINFKSEQGYATDENGNLVMDRQGNVRTTNIDRKEYVRQQIAEMEKAQRQIDEAQAKLADENVFGSEREKYEKQFENATTNLESYKADVSKVVAELNDEALAFYDANGVVVAGFEQDVAEIEALSDAFNMFDLTPTEKALAKVESYFSGFSGKNLLQEKLLEIVESNDDVNAVSEALQAMGLDLESAGIDAETLDRYFREMAESANEAADATGEIDNNLGIEEVDFAFNSENAGDTYVKMNDYLQKAKELYDQGLVGTDEFKAVAELISYNIDSSTESFAKNYEKLQRYFIEDSEGNLTGQGVQNFLTDLQALGKGYATFNEETESWELNMSNTAQAAKEMDMSVQSFEALLGRIKDYDNVGEFDFVSVIDAYNEAKSSLEGLEEIYENLGDSEYKDSLGLKLDEWTPIIEAAEDDLASLPDEIVTKLTFEYDLASLKKMIEDADNQWKAGNRSEEVGADRIVAREAYRETREEQTGYTESSDAGYAKTYSQLQALSQQFDQATDDTMRQTIQDRMSGIIELQNAFQDLLASGEQMDWNTFLQTDQAQILLSGLAVDIRNALEIPQHLQYDVNLGINSDKIEKDMEELAAGSTIEFTANIEGVEHQITALKEEDGTITYTAEVDGKSEEVVLNQSGTVFYFKDGQEAPTSGLAGVYYNWLGQQQAQNDTAGVDYVKTGQENPEEKTVGVWYKVKGVIGKIANFISGGNSLAGTAHLEGTAHAKGTLGDTSFIKDKWRTKKDETALVGEEGQELVATRDGYFYTVGDTGAEFTDIPAGSVVFNARQTKDLLTKGHIRGRGKAHLVGTAHLAGTHVEGHSYLGSASGKFSFTGGAYTYNKNAGKSTKKTATKATKEAKKSAEETAETFDWIEVLLERVQRAISNLNKVAAATYRVWSTRNEALAKEITAVNDEIDYQNQAYKEYINEANAVGLSSTYKKKVQNGTIDIQTIKNEDLADKIKEYQELYEKALDCQDAVIDLKDELAELAKMEFENVEQAYEDKLSEIEHRAEMLELSIDSIEAQGYIVSTKMYESLISVEKEQISTLQEEYNALTSQLTESMEDGSIEKYSQDWYELTGSINNVEKAIAEANIELIEFQKTMRQIEWDVFDMTQDMIGEIPKESNFLINLMSNDKLVENDGSFTEQGQATLGLHAANMNTYMSQAKDYADELAEIEKELATDQGKYDTELLERRAELLELQRDMIEASEDEKQAIKSLIKDSYDAFLNSLNAIIDKRKDMLSSVRDEYSFQMDIESQVKEISSLEKQLAVVQRDTSEEGRVTVQKLKNSLEEAKRNLEQTEYDKYIQDQQRMLDLLSDETEQWVNTRLDNLDFLVSEVVTATNASAESISDTLHTEAEQVGYTLTDAMTAIWDTSGTFGSVVVTYGEQMNTQLTTVNSVLEQIRSYMAGMIGESDKKADENTTKVETPKSETPKTETPKADTSKKETTKQSTDKTIKVGGKINAKGAKIYDYAGDKSGETQYFKNDPIYTVLAEKDGYLRVRHHKLKSGVTGWFKKKDVKAYKTGGMVDYTGLAWVDGTKEKPEAFLDPEDTERIGELTDTLKRVDFINDTAKLFAENGISIPYGSEEYFNKIQAMNRVPTYVSNNNNVNKTIENHLHIENITLPNVMDYNSFIHTLQHDKRTENIIQSMTLGRMLNKNSMEKFKY